MSTCRPTCCAACAIEYDARQQRHQPIANVAPVVTEVSKLTLHPGDVLIVRTTMKLSRDMHSNLKAWLTDQLPASVHTLILDPTLGGVEVAQRQTQEGAPS